MGVAAALIIGLISFAGTILSMMVGQGISQLLPSKLPNIIGGLIIFAVGLVGIVRCLIHSTADADQPPSDKLSSRESIALGFALAANNTGLGIGARITGMHTLSTALFVLVLCLMFLYIGNRLGRIRVARHAGKCTECFANGLMILLGIYEMLV
jgi:putative Mn2+ efflux pump MntP